MVPGGNLHLFGTGKTASPMLEGNAGVAKVRVLEREHLREKEIMMTDQIKALMFDEYLVAWGCGRAGC